MALATFFSVLNSGLLTFLAPGLLFCKAHTVCYNTKTINKVRIHIYGTFLINHKGRSTTDIVMCA